MDPDLISSKHGVSDCDAETRFDNLVGEEWILTPMDEDPDQSFCSGRVVSFSDSDNKSK